MVWRLTPAARASSATAIPRRLRNSASRLSITGTDASRWWGGPLVLGSPLGTTPPSASCTLHDTDTVAAEAGSGGPARTCRSSPPWQAWYYLLKMTSSFLHYHFRLAGFL